MTEVIQHVVTAPEHHAWLEDRPLEPGCSNDFLGGPFGLVVRRSAVRSSTEKAHERQTASRDSPGCAHNVCRACYMNRLVGLRSSLAIDTRAMGDRVAT